MHARSSLHGDRNMGLKIPSAAGKVLECDSAACNMGGKEGSSKTSYRITSRGFFSLPVCWGEQGLGCGVQAPEGGRLRPVQPHSLKKTMRVLKASVRVFHNEQLCSGAMKMNAGRMLLYYRSQQLLCCGTCFLSAVQGSSTVVKASCPFPARGCRYRPLGAAGACFLPCGREFGVGCCRVLCGECLLQFFSFPLAGCLDSWDSNV